MTFDEWLEQILWWKARELERDTLVSLGLQVRVIFGKCARDMGEQWSLWAGSLEWPPQFLCFACGNHRVTAERYEEWPFDR